MKQKNRMGRSKKCLYTFFMFFFFFSINMVAQNFLIKGKVVDPQNQPLIGANIVEVGNTTNGTVTDYDGNFSLNVAPNAQLLISYMGYKQQTISIQGQKFIKVTLKENTQLLEETVIIGYGSMKKSDMTGAITSVDTEALASRATTNPAEALQGKVAGVNILKSGGNAGAGVSVKIRGITTMGSNEPLYIIDGFPSSITNVNPNDIASMEILKDGAAAAIYGSVAANGVVIITTKSGKKGETEVELNLYVTRVEAAKKLKMLDADGYLKVHNMMYENAGKEKPGYLTFTNTDGSLKNPTGFNTNWQDEMLRTGLTQNYNLNIRGGSEKTKYAISYNHSDEKGIFLGNKFKQDLGRIKVNTSKSIFDFDASLTLKITESQQPQYSIKEMYSMAPMVPVYDKNQPSGYGLNTMTVDGVNLEMPNFRNVMADDHFIESKSNTYKAIANVGISMHFTPWLTFRTAYAYRGDFYRLKYHRTKYTPNIQQERLYPYNSVNNSYWYEHTFDNTLTFDKDFKKHSLTVLLGSSIQSARSDNDKVSVEGKKTEYSVKNGDLVSKEVPAGFFDPNATTIDAGDGGTYTGSGSFWEYNRASFFGRINYSYDGKYLLQATLRADGSSKFGKNNRWGIFPSVALGWRISEEDFFHIDAISNLKLRMSWGRLGNENALGYYYAPTMTSSNWQWMSYVQGAGNPWPGMVNLYLVQDDLKWETTDTKNIGLDFGFFKNKLTGTLNYYYNTTEDLLIEKVMAPSAGIYNPVVNVGKMRNKGFELELNYADQVDDFHYNVGLNLSTTDNEMLKADPNQILYGSALKGEGHFATQTFKGNPVASFMLYRTHGIFQSEDEVNMNYTQKNGQAVKVDKDGKPVLLQPNAKPGDIRFKDLNQDGVIDENDKEYCGSGIPKLEANLSFYGSYKGFDLSFLIGGAWGHHLYNANRLFYEAMDAGTNLMTTTLEAWTPENRNSGMPRAIIGDPSNNTRESDRFLESGDFIRMRQLQIGYSLPKSLLASLSLKRCRFYISGENLFTITGYSGIDPEFSSGILNTGVDRFIYPFTRSYVAGVQISF